MEKSTWAIATEIGFFVSGNYIYLMGLALGINCINLTGNNIYLMEVKRLADQMGLDFYAANQPRQIQALRYVLWIAPNSLQELRIWLNRIDYSLSGQTRIAWIPGLGAVGNLPVALDFAIYGSATTALEQLITTQQKAFSPFFDHIPNLAFKNALGAWTMNT